LLPSERGAMNGEDVGEAKQVIYIPEYFLDPSAATFDNR